MLKFFFNLYFQYELSHEYDKETLTSTFNLGYYSSNKKIIEAISFYHKKQGFCEFDINCFKVQKFGVHFENDIDKEHTELFELTFEDEKCEYGEWTLFGVFSTKQLAEEERFRQQRKRKYENYTDGFHVERWEVNNCSSWQDGFDRIS